jgi:large subunit ribosomal protein L32
MGALPKRKISSRRRGNRRSQQRAVVVQLSRCPKCRSMRPNHHACPTCGFYKDRTAIAIPLPEAPGSAA